MPSALRDRHFFALLVLLCITRGLLAMAVYPPWKIADEPAHFDNIQFRAEHRQHKPVWDGSETDKVMSRGASKELRLSWEASQKYFRGGYLPFSRSVPEEDEFRKLAPRSDSKVTDGQMPALDYPGAYYALGTLPYVLFRHTSIIGRLYAVRFMSLLLSLIPVLLTFVIARDLCDSRALAFAAGCIVALQPIEAQMSIAVNNDIGVVAVYAIVFWLQMRVVQRLPQVPDASSGIVLGATMGLAILVKTQGLLSLATTGLLLGWLILRAPRSLRVWRYVGAVGLAFALVRLFPVAVGWVYPDPQPVMHVSAAAASSHADFSFSSLLGFPRWVWELPDHYRDQLFRSAWGEFCWLEFEFQKPWFERIHAAITLCCLGGIAAVALRSLTSKDQPVWFKKVPVLWVALTALGGVLFILWCEFWARLVLRSPYVIQGRNFLFVLPAFAVLSVIALGSLVPARFRTLAASGIVIGMIGLDLGALVTVATRNYGG